MFFYWTDFLLVPDACITLADVFGIHGFLVQVWGSAARNDDDKVPPNKISLAKSRNDTFYRSDIHIIIYIYILDYTCVYVYSIYLTI